MPVEILPASPRLCAALICDRHPCFVQEGRVPIVQNSMWAISVFEALLLTATKSAEVEGSKLESNKWEELEDYLWVMPPFLHSCKLIVCFKFPLVLCEIMFLVISSA